MSGAAPDIRGIWRLVAARATDADGLEQPSMYGPSPVGTAQFENGRLTAVLADGRADLPPGTKRTFIAFAGPYAVGEGTMTYWPDASSWPDYVGTEQVRGLRIDGTRMVLTPPPYVRDGRMLRLDLEWVRIG